jgi:hypothetical protein
MSSRPALGPTQPPIQWVPGAVSPGVKRLEREADHSPPTSAKVKKMCIYTSTPPFFRDNITFTFTEQASSSGDASDMWQVTDWFLRQDTGYPSWYFHGIPQSLR